MSPNKIAAILALVVAVVPLGYAGYQSRHLDSGRVNVERGTFEKPARTVLGIEGVRGTV
jgi:hypothetical protein